MKQFSLSTGTEGIKTIEKFIGEHHGQMYIKPYKSYTTQFKLEVPNFIKETGTSIRGTAAIFNIATHSTIQKW